MTQAQRKTSAASPRRPARRRIEYIASVRFLSGDKQLYSVSNARTPEHARAMVTDELSDVMAVLVAERA